MLFRKITGNVAYYFGLNKEVRDERMRTFHHVIQISNNIIFLLNLSISSFIVMQYVAGISLTSFLLLVLLRKQTFFVLKVQILYYNIINLFDTNNMRYTVVLFFSNMKSKGYILRCLYRSWYPSKCFLCRSNLCSHHCDSMVHGGLCKKKSVT